MARVQGLAGLTSKAFEDILTHWIKSQRIEGVQRSDLFDSEEGHAQTRRILTTLTECAETARTGEDFDLEDEEWKPVKQVLHDISMERTSRGVTPIEMAQFVMALKPPVLTHLRQRLAEKPAELVEEILHVSRIVDQLALFTTELFLQRRDEIIQRQQAEMMELSTPVVQLWSRIVALPLIGTVDSERALAVMENLLQGIVQREAEIAIIDITGVPTVDTQVAQHLLRTAAAVRLMGAECVLSGISPKIAQTIVQLGVELPDIETRSDMENALAYAFGRLGYSVSGEHSG